VQFLIADCGVPGSVPSLPLPVQVLVDRKDRFWDGYVVSSFGDVMCLALSVFQGERMMHGRSGQQL
jgi:hypothetical protein